MNRAAGRFTKSNPSNCVPGSMKPNRPLQIQRPGQGA